MYKEKKRKKELKELKNVDNIDDWRVLLKGSDDSERIDFWIKELQQ